MTKGLIHVLLAVVAAIAVTTTLSAQGMPAQGGVDMPNAKQMSGMPLPMGDLAVGSVTVRVVRGAMTNPLPNQKVELVGDATVDATTNDTGRAEFTNLTPGAKVKAIATVEGERLESQEFTVPAAGGIRVALVATDPEMAKREEEDRKLAAGPAKSGIVVLGEGSRFVFEIGDDGLSVFNFLDIQNTARTPVDPAVPIVFDLPAAAERAATLEQSSPLATVAGKRVTVNGPFPPGTTTVQFAYTLPYSGDAAVFSQTLPAALAQLTVIAQKVGDLSISSPQLRSQGATHNDDGVHFIFAQGPPLAAGAELTVAFSGLPNTPVWPRNLAVALAALTLIGGFVAASRGRRASGAVAERVELEKERERLFGRLTTLEAAHRGGRIDPDTYA